MLSDGFWCCYGKANDSESQYGKCKYKVTESSWKVRHKTGNFKLDQVISIYSLAGPLRASAAWLSSSAVFEPRLSLVNVVLRPADNKKAR